MFHIANEKNETESLGTLKIHPYSKPHGFNYIIIRWKYSLETNIGQDSQFDLLISLWGKKFLLTHNFSLVMKQ